VNRAVVELYLMKPQTPHALFLLNIIFMTACKHLGRTSDIKRAIQFRERARGKEKKKKTTPFLHFFFSLLLAITPFYYDALL
jgi:hypothetical protein